MPTAPMSAAIDGCVMASCSHTADRISSPIVRAFGNDRFADAAHIRRMANHLKAWREHRKLTQEELADKAGTSKSVISDLENEKRGLSSKWLRRLAPILGTAPGHLLDHDPSETNADILDIWAGID